jgi:hypothetical protein
MKRHAWNYDLSTKPDKDIFTVTNRHVPVVSILVRIMFCCVLLFPADRRDVVCHLVGRG